MADRSARILLVDDEQSIQTLLSYPLRRDGYEVVQATDGRQALDRFEEQPFDLVVLDLMLPKIDGLEVCRRLRSRSSVPIIMLTAKSEEIDKVVGPRARRRRLHHQAVLAARVLEPDQGGAAACGDEPAGRDRPGRGAARGPRAADRLPQAQRSRPRRTRPSSPTSSSRSSLHWPGPRAGCSRATCCWRGSGATPRTVTRARSTSTSGTCARRSSATRRTPSTCSPCAASVIASATRSPESDAKAPALAAQQALRWCSSRSRSSRSQRCICTSRPGSAERDCSTRSSIELAGAAHRTRDPISRTRRGIDAGQRRARRWSGPAAARSGDRVTLMSVVDRDRAGRSAALPQADSSGPSNGSPRLRLPAALSGRPRAGAPRPATERTPIRHDRRGRLSGLLRRPGGRA